uniref:Carboxypeptidase inhibitor n=1 Tax=Strigamia maritima TaxID=126957 RepID=T1IJ32_STRMM
PAVYNEENCLKEGGVCGQVEFCPKKDRKPGLCPLQQSGGVDCCATNPTDPNSTKCGRHGGECSTLNCGKSIEKGSVCPPGEKCCIWL